ncbi:MAG: phosphoglycerate kinase [Vampirovibrionia bacterium]
MMKKTINDLTNIKGKKVLVRADFNVPLDENRNVTDDTRIKAVLPTIEYLKQAGAKVILASHLGRPKGEAKDEFRLDPVSKRLSQLLRSDVKKLNDCIGDEVAEAVNQMKDGDVILLENVRFYNEETKNDDAFAKKLASLADLYVNDAFGTAHRAHASTEGVTKYLSPCVAGYLMEKELENLGKILENPEFPFIAIIGGSKVSSKIGILENLIDKVDTLIIGGGMIFTFLKAQGYNIGKSLLEEDKVELAKTLLQKAKDKNVGIILAKDVIVASEVKAGVQHKIVSIKAIPDDMMGLDIGPDTREEIRQVILTSKTILWNGPMGVFEIDEFEGGTLSVAKNLAEVTKNNGAATILGGGDTVAALEKFGIGKNSYTHVSTGGGASLEFLEGKELPGVAALDEACGCSCC